jgi:hypothetical protein
LGICDVVSAELLRRIQDVERLSEERRQIGRTLIVNQERMFRGEQAQRRTGAGHKGVQFDGECTGAIAELAGPDVCDSAGGSHDSPAVLSNAFRDTLLFADDFFNNGDPPGVPVEEINLNAAPGRRRGGRILDYKGRDVKAGTAIRQLFDGSRLLCGCWSLNSDTSEFL